MLGSDDQIAGGPRLRYEEGAGEANRTTRTRETFWKSCRDGAATTRMAEGGAPDDREEHALQAEMRE
jgi:hypothetical protein